MYSTETNQQTSLDRAVAQLQGRQVSSAPAPISAIENASSGALLAAEQLDKIAAELRMRLCHVLSSTGPDEAKQSPERSQGSPVREAFNSIAAVNQRTLDTLMDIMARLEI